MKIREKLILRLALTGIFLACGPSPGTFADELSDLKERIKQLEKENEMLREVIKTYTQKDPSAK